MTRRRALLFWLFTIGVCVAAGWLVSDAASAALILSPSAHATLERTVAGRKFELDCSYAATDAVAATYPAWHGEPAIVYAHSWVCSRLNRVTATGWRGADRDGTAAMAVLVMTHESLHVAGMTDETATECKAVAIVGRVFVALGAPAGMLPRLLMWAGQAHAGLLARWPSLYHSCPAAA